MERSAQPTGNATPADIDRNGRPTSIGMLEGSTRSRDTCGDERLERDVVEAGLNEAAVGREVYGR
jgi:hypothetical protein